MRTHHRSLGLVLVALSLAPSVTDAQSTALSAALTSWIGVDAPVGEEARFLRSLVAPLSAASGATVAIDPLGNLVLRKGRGAPTRVVACAMDKPGFAVTQITADGLLRLHRVGNVAHPLWDQAHEGQQLEVLTMRGTVPAVSAIANGHFAQQHRKDSLVTTAYQLWVDVGARSASEVAALGIRVLDPVQRRLAPWAFADRVAGTQAGARVGCAALAAAARGDVTQGTTIFVFSVQSTFGWPGLGGVLARAADADGQRITASPRRAQVTVLTEGRAERVNQWSRAGNRSPVNAAVYRAGGIDSLQLLAPAVKFAGTLVENVTTSEADWLLSEVRRAAAVGPVPSDPWVALPVRVRRAEGVENRAASDPHAATARRLQQLADLPATPGHEWRVREAIRAQLPAWAKAVATVDSIGNLLVAVGPARDTIVFMAHMDEVAFAVDAMGRDGTLRLRAMGGPVTSAWEGQPAILHLPPRSGTPPDTLLGVFVPRDTARLRTTRTLTAWFGLDSAALVARGVRVGMGLTSPKTSTRLAGARFTGRSMDDRAGSTALLMAVQALNPMALDHAVKKGDCSGRRRWPIASGPRRATSTASTPS
jgi:putative aminopeptidase